MKTTELPIKEIELLRNKLIETGLKQGLTAPKTVVLSQKLDKLLNICYGS